MKSKQELEQEISKTMGEIADILKKSDMIKKDDEPLPDEIKDQGEEIASDTTAQHEGAESPEMESQEHAEGQEAPDESGMEEKSMADHAAELSTEELDELIDALMAEKEKRHGAEGQEAAPEMPPPEVEKSMKEEFASLAKSMKDQVAEMFAGLKSEVDALKKSSVSSKPKTVTQAAAFNPHNVQVLEKSTPAKQRLSKSETITFLQSEQRRRNPSVNTDLIADVVGCQDDKELHGVQDKMHKMGIKLPE